MRIKPNLPTFSCNTHNLRGHLIARNTRTSNETLNFCDNEQLKCTHRCWCIKSKKCVCHRYLWNILRKIVMTCHSHKCWIHYGCLTFFGLCLCHEWKKSPTCATETDRILLNAARRAFIASTRAVSLSPVHSGGKHQSAVLFIDCTPFIEYPLANVSRLVWCANVHGVIVVRCVARCEMGCFPHTRFVHLFKCNRDTNDTHYVSPFEQRLTFSPIAFDRIH